jgi:uroporphyrinogen III methyltransferase / synthase
MGANRPDGKPFVYLVGAGPGAEDLITVKGLNCLKQADVVLYDRLSGVSLLKEAPADAEFIDVGKQPDHHPVPQDEINRLLIEKAAAGRIVVRLKGGDPFVFGRGGEEAMALEAAGIPFEVVPGISSAIAVPSYAGIPVTHRHVSTSFHVITGHEDPEKETESVNFQALAQLTGTLVFLMGVGQLARIAEQLMQFGKAPDTPAALVYKGTTAYQRTVTGTLETIAEKVKNAGLKPPCVIVIGEVVALRPALSWFEKKPLFGKKILVTRSRTQASALSKKLHSLGADVQEFATIEIRPVENREPIRQALGQLHQYDHIVFTSVNGVTTFMDALLESGRDVRCLSPESEITAIGHATAEALSCRGLALARVPEIFTAEGVLNVLAPVIRSGQKVLLPRAEIARPQLVSGLTALGAVVDDVPMYETAIPDADPEVLRNLFRKPPDWVTFTSASTVNHLMHILKKADVPFPESMKIAVIGPVTAAAVQKHGLTVCAAANPHTIEGLAAVIEKECTK